MLFGPPLVASLQMCRAFTTVGRTANPLMLTRAKIALRRTKVCEIGTLKVRTCLIPELEP